MRACILSIGSEIMLGHITDTNAAWLARELADLGIELRMVMQVGDDRQLLLDALRRATELAEVVICTGGIGPTDDDLTRETIADLVEETPSIDDRLVQELRGFFAQSGRVMPERNSKQAWTIPSSTTLPNPVGTAPGWFVEKDGTIIVAMPGVPREMYRMWTEQARPRLLRKSPRQVIDTLQIKTVGIGESDAEERIHHLVVPTDPQVATYAKDDGVHIHITATGSDAEEARRKRDQAREEVYRILGPFIWGENTDTLAGVLARRIAQLGYLLNIHEFGTGAGLAAMLATDPEASRLFRAHVSGASPDATPEIDALRTPDPRTVDVVLSYAGEIDEQRVSRGMLDLTILHTSLAEPRRASWQLRGSPADIQRRSALNAIFELNRWLQESPATT